HNGFPGTDPSPTNFVRLRDALSHHIIAEATPPRNDIAQRIVWDLRSFAKGQASIEIIDGDDGPAYAWLAFGRIDPPVIAMPQSSARLDAQRQQAACAIVHALHLSELREALHHLMNNPATDDETRAA